VSAPLPTAVIFIKESSKQLRGGSGYSLKPVRARRRGTSW
jgi:hypothetical protein